jgi:hypothetical protein
MRLKAGDGYPTLAAEKNRKDGARSFRDYVGEGQKQVLPSA